MKRLTAAVVVAFAAVSGPFVCGAGVTKTETAPVVDGRLDESCWSKAEWNGGFVKLANRVKDREVDAQTSFAILADSRAVYVAIKCDEREMADLKARPASGLYNCDNVELFLSPRGDGFDFYQFVVAFNPHSGVDGADARYASEGGNITPDPYGPEWSFARGETEDGWCVEIAIPFSSFYMTRNVEWRDTWCVNVARQRGVGKSELTTWSPLQVKFGEPDRFRKISGFPKRSDADDVGITDVVAEMTGRQNDKLIGTLSFATAVAVDGEYEVSSPYASTTAVRLKSGVNAVRVPCAYSSNGRFPTKISLKRMATDEIYSRTYSVSVDFEDVRVKLTSPEYRDNFYPGQDSSHVKGRVETACDGEVALTLAGPGFQKCEARLPRGGGEFDFDTSGFKDGTAVLSVAAGGMTKEFKIRKLAKTARRMSWISQGRLVVDGKPVLRRGIYAKGYMGGKAFAEKFDSDKRLYMTPEVSQGGTLEPGRVIKGLEAREARKDIVPCKEYFDKIDAMIEASKEKDFAYWYISDEPECRGLSQVYLRHVYEHMKEKDPYHVVLTATRAGKQYLDCADWFETHPYINPRDDGRGNRILDRPMSSIGDFLDAFDAQNHPDKCVGFLPTMFAYRYASILNDYPTFQEYVCHVWAAMMRGSKTLWPFFYWDMGDRAALYEGNRYVNSTFASLDDFILDGKRTTLFKTKDAECVRWDLENGESMFAFANFTNKRLDMALPKGLEDRKWHPFRGQWAEGRALEPYEVVVGTTDERGTDLETYAEAQKLVDGQEYERTHRDNQILEKYLAVEATSSNGKVRLYKLVDGIHDVLGWLAKGKDHWAEFSFTDNPVIFSRVRVYGSGLDGMKVSIRKGGEWKELEPKAVKTEKYMRELDFGTVESTVKMRLSFSAATVELYELEIPHADGDSPNLAESCKGPSSAELEDSANVLWSLYDGGSTVRDKVSHLAKIDPEYPWIEFEADSFVPLGGRVYRAWSLWFLKHGFIAGTVTHPQTGLYVVRAPKVEKPVSATLRLDDYNLEIGVKRLRCVRRPSNYIVAEASREAGTIIPGSVLDVTLNLATPCEDVTATLLIDYGHGGGLVAFPVNGTNAIELKATKDGGGRVWKASIPVKSCGMAKARQVYVKCVVLGGALKIPLFTAVNQPFVDQEANCRSLRVGTWNIRNSKGDEGTENSWERRRDDVVSLIKKLDVDVIGLQEVLPDQAEFLKASLPDYAFVGDHRGVDRKTDEASPVVYRKNRFLEKSSGTFWLSETPEVPASKSWQTACPRVCSYVILVDKTTGKRFCFANTHTDHSSELAREKGMMLIVERMKKFGEGAPIVFVGDHNCSYGTKPAAEVRAVLSDTRDIAREVSGPSYTFHAFGKREVGPIDYVYVSRDIDVLDLVAYGDKCKDGSHYPSDHFPLTSTIAWGK